MARATREDLEQEIAELRSKLAVSEETLRAIQSGEVDALVIEGDCGPHVYTLEGAEHPYRVLIEEMAQGAVTLSRDGSIAFCNLRFAQMLQRPVEGVVGSFFLDFIAEKDRHYFMALEQRAWESAARGEFLLKKSDGHDVPIYVAMSAVDIGHDRTLCVVATDLSEQKRDEAIVAEELLARSLFDSVAEGILVCDDQGRIIRASEVAFQLAGRHPLMECVDDVFDLEDERGEPFSIRKALSGPRRQGVELYCRAKTCILLVSIGPIANAVGERLGAIVTLTDITDRKNFERDLAKAKEAADEANHAKSAFLANMSHEIRTPLGAIMGFAELLKETDLKSDERSHFIETIARNGHALTHLIDDILDLSKVEAGKIDMEQARFSLANLLSEVEASLKVIALKNNTKLIFNTEGPVPKEIISDVTRLRQILMNIVGNAVKFTTNGYVKVLMRAEPVAHRQEVELHVSVEDTGCGISPENHHLLFQCFVQGDSSMTRKFGGTGLGLVLSKRLSQALGGDVTLVKSAPGVGSVFAIRVVAGTPRELNFPLGSSKGLKINKMDKRLQLAGLNVLLAEDSLDNQVLIERFLVMKGASVDIVSNGAEAIDRAMSGHHDLVLMDVQMPLLDGHRATQELRRQGYSKPIIALTAHAMTEERDKCLQSGCNAFLTKPIDYPRLIDALMSCAASNTVLH